MDLSCELTDETTLGPLDPIIHRVYPTNAPVFDMVFEIWMTDTVDANWEQSAVDWLALNIMDNDSTNTSNDLFAMVWDYFCIAGVGDLNPSYAGVKFWLAGQDSAFTKIKITLYSPVDLGTPCAFQDGGSYPDVLCRGNATVLRNEIFLNATSSGAWEARGHFAHEFQHLCWAANGFQQTLGFDNANETLATLAEHFADTPRIAANYPYDSSVLRRETCDQYSKYQIERLWMTYLYETFKGGAGISDDVIFRWIRDLTPTADQMKLTSLAEALWDPAYSSASWAGGNSATERLDNVFQHFAVAKFANAPDFAPNSRYGIGTANSVLDFHFFEDNYPQCCVGTAPCAGKTPMLPVDCPYNGTSPSTPIYPSANNCTWNVRILPPSYELGSSHNNVTTTASGIYIDLDTSRDYIDVSEYGTDYIIFRSGSYFEDGLEHELRLTISGEAEYPEAYRALTPFAWVLGYCCEEANLQTHPEDLLFATPVEISSGDAAITVNDFGRGVRAVVLVVGAVSQHPERFDYLESPINRFMYEYTYRVDTRSTQTVAWGGDVFVLGDVTVPSGGTLVVNPGTNVKVFPLQDLATTEYDPGLVEFNVEGTLVADGTAADPIVVKSWTEASNEDWFGFYFDNASGGGTFDHCVISNAIYAIESYVPVTVTNTEISNCFYGVFALAGALVQNCTLTDFKFHGIYLDFGGASTVRNSIIDGANYCGLVKHPGTSVVVRNSQFKNCDVGLWGTGSGSVNVDSTCYFYSNENGIRLSNAGSSSTIRAGGITYNTLDAIVCDNSSHPLIEGNIFANNGGGIYCSNNSSPTIKANQIQSSGNAVTATTGANPDVGHYSSSGFNSIAHTGMYVVNYTSNSVYAQNNCWDNDVSPCRPPTNKFVGNVNRTNPICCEFDTYEGGEGDPPGPVAPFEPTKANATGLVAIVPNPFNPTTTIHYSLASQGHVELNIYDVAGRLVEELTRGTQSAGPHAAVWNGTDRQGSPVASGVYFVRMASTGQVFTKKMILLK